MSWFLTRLLSRFPHDSGHGSCPASSHSFGFMSEFLSQFLTPPIMVLVTVSDTLLVGVPDPDPLTVTVTIFVKVLVTVLFMVISWFESRILS